MKSPLFGCILLVNLLIIPVGLSITQHTSTIVAGFTPDPDIGRPSPGPGQPSGPSRCGNPLRCGDNQLS